MSKCKYFAVQKPKTRFSHVARLEKRKESSLDLSGGHQCRAVIRGFVSRSLDLCV